MPEFEVNAIRHETGNTITTNIDSTTVGNLANIQTLLPTIPYKQQYNGGLTTLSYRGTSAEQHAILWDGINLNSAFLGLFDLSNLPLLGNHTYNGLTTANSMLEGNQIMGLRINLKSRADFDNDRISISNQVGSFGLFTNNVSASFTDGKNNLQINTQYQHAKNNYTYHENNQTKKVDNADFNFWDIHAKWASKINFYWRFQTDIWWQNHFRNIPFSANKPYLKDKALRSKSHLSYHNPSKKITLTQTIAFFEEEIDYNDDKSNLKRFINQTTFKKDFIKFSFETKFNYEYQTPETQHYDNNVKRHLINPNIKVKYTLKKHSLTAISSATLLNAQLYSPSFKLLYSHKLSKQAKINYLFTCNNRLPTFNELYWNPGGNNNLKSETGFENEITFSYWLRPPKKHNLKHSISVQIYHRHVNNLIQWIRESNPFFEAQNIKKTRSYGLETAYSLHQKKGNNIQDFQVTASYNNSQTIGSFKKILPYNPKFKINYIYSYTFKEKTRFNISSQFTSKQYTNNDNSENIKGYSITDLSVSRKFIIDNQEIELTVTGYNILNQQYETFNNRPAIGRNYSLTIKLNLK